ncbi:MAG: hypothetical protein IT292_11090 [Deltaproteobacteria bacterium]|nr:hypothetical protein [Deltaproteobacteria bacterium]
MAGAITSSIAPQASIVVSSHQAATAKPQAAPHAGQALQGQSSALSQASTIVTLSGNTKRRGASSGTAENRALDASFEKQEIQDQKAETKEGGEEGGKGQASGTLVNIEA